MTSSTSTRGKALPGRSENHEEATIEVLEDLLACMRDCRAVLNEILAALNKEK